jgi:hypothetical protein
MFHERRALVRRSRFIRAEFYRKGRPESFRVFLNHGDTEARSRLALN